MAAELQDVPKFNLPSDYTFAPGGKLVHKDTYQRLEKLLEAAQNRDPDLHDMYIYNDFFGYGVLELVDQTLSSIHTFVIKKKYFDAWRALDCLCTFSNDHEDWKHVDDGERVVATVQAYGAMLVTAIRALEKQSLFNDDEIPNLEESLMGFAQDFNPGNDWEEPFNQLIKAYGRKLFGDRTKEDSQRMWASKWDAYFEYAKSLTDEERKKRGEVLPDEKNIKKSAADSEDEDEDEDEEDSEPWFHNANVKDTAMKDRAFAVTRTWKEYKDILVQSPRMPSRGPPTWDLTEWTDEEKKPFAFEHFR